MFPSGDTHYAGVADRASRCATVADELNRQIAAEGPAGR